jgi:hypothetical protein
MDHFNTQWRSLEKGVRETSNTISLFQYSPVFGKILEQRTAG